LDNNAGTLSARKPVFIKAKLTGAIKQQLLSMFLYDSRDVKYVKGTLLVETFMPFAETTRILEDSNGEVILVALHNFLPDGLYGW
jgi:hypothetical protein